MIPYDHKKIEKKWQRFWEQKKLYKTSDSAEEKDNFYALVEFPYPSGNLHTGHWYAFSVPDIFVRKKRMEGKNILFPIGFDAFGLPAENAAIKRGFDPKKWTYENIDYMRRQLRSMGASFDWSREVITADQEYYKWTQWIFLQFFKKGLAYRAETAVNWCPKDKTVLANEQVAAGKCERCGAEVEQRQMRQWMLRITDYAERLLSGLDKLNWKDEIKQAQRNWIGKSEGAEIEFEIKNGIASSYVLLHGYTCSPNDNFFPWLKKTLENRGAKVYAPKLPNTDDPRVYDQAAEVLKSVPFNKDTVIVGHSLGSVVALKIIEQLKVPVRKTIIVAGFTENKFIDEPFEVHTFDWKFNVKKIRQNAGKVCTLRDTIDDVVPQFQAENIKKLIGGKIFDFTASEPHASGKIEPEILRHCIDSVRVFTTRPDTLFGATYVVLAPEHELVQSLDSRIENLEEVKKYIGEAKRKTPLQRQQETKEKTGVELKGVKAINPTSKEEIPVWIADYVLSGYGTGAIMAVPAHDERDFEFASKFGLPIKHVVIPSVVDHVNPPRPDKSSKTRINVHALVYDPVNKKYLIIRNKKFGWDTVVIGGVEEGEKAISAALRELMEETGYVDLEFKRILGAPAKAVYFAKHKDENRIAITTAVYFELKSDKRVAIAEDGENEGNEILWIDAKDFVPGKMVNSELPYWLERLKAGTNMAYAGNGALINSGKFEGMDSEDAKKKITEFVGGEIKTQYKLRDWVVSRQRYWGVPIPIIYCEKCGVSAVSEKDLPVKLPDIKDYLPTGEGKSPLAKATKWLSVKCPVCGGNAERETDTLDTFVDSSWYFLRYCDPKNKKSFADAEKMSAWMPVDLYSGGAEHTTIHLLYSRFWYKAMYDLGLLGGEAAKLGDPSRLGEAEADEPYSERRNRGIILGPDGQKMSKSKGNVIDPDEYVAKFGSDTVRMYLAFIGPYSEAGSYPWDPHGILGIRRFLDRVWAMASTKNLLKAEVFQDFSQRDGARLSNSPAGEYAGLEKSAAEASIVRTINKTIKQVSENIEDFKFNTAISAMMILLNEVEKQSDAISHKQYVEFLKILAPFAPHLTEEIWQKKKQAPKGGTGKGWKSIHLEKWPEYDPKMLEEENYDLVVQINGKTRDKFSVSVNISQSEAEHLTLAREKVKLALDNKQLRKIIFVPKRLINIVV